MRFLDYVLTAVAYVPLVLLACLALYAMVNEDVHR